MEEIIDKLRNLIEDRGTSLLLDTDLIKEYITADMDLLVEEIREKILTEY
jgi:hypothetical protein